MLEELKSIVYSFDTSLSTNEKALRIKKKLLWKKEAKLFFVLFAALQEAGYIQDSPTTLGNYLGEIFLVHADKISKKKSASKTPEFIEGKSFHQYLKRKSGEYLKKEKENIDVLIKLLDSFVMK